MGKLINRSRDEEKRRNLRRRCIPAEVLLWHHLRNRQLGGFKFKRQYGIAHYVVNFCCPASQLIVELDGASHEDEGAVEYDRMRQAYLESLGFLVVRFHNNQIYKQMTNVLENLLHLCELRLCPSPRHPVDLRSPTRQGEGA